VSSPELIGPPAIRQRSRRFASLRAAQRILSHSVHPGELEATFEQGRRVLLELQGLTARVGEGSREASEHESLAQIDALLDAISARTRELLEQTPIAELRAHLPEVAQQHPEELRGLIETILEGGVERTNNLRTLEYLVTLLCSEPRGARRQVVRGPAEAAPQLAAFVEAHVRCDPEQMRAAEQAIASATQRVFQAEDVGPIRDRIRGFKENLGAGVLHPRVLAAVVHYNVAMANRVAGIVEGSRLLDRMAEELLGEAARPAAGPETRGPARASGAGRAAVFDSAPLAQLVAALRRRIGGRPAGGQAADRAAARLELSGLGPHELEAFEAPEQDARARTVCTAVALHLLLGSPEADALLAELGIAREVAEGQWRVELMREMTAGAQKLLADGNFAEACHLSEIRAKNLGVVARLRGPEREVSRLPQAPAEEKRGALPLDASQLGKLAVVAALVLWLVLMGGLFSSSGDVEAVDAELLARISPYVVSGYRSEEDGSVRFVGSVNVAWDALDTEARRAAAAQIGTELAREGMPNVVLLDRFHRHQLTWSHGRLVELAEKAGG
jgi:hypothetical protein